MCTRRERKCHRTQSDGLLTSAKNDSYIRALRTGWVKEFGEGAGYMCGNYTSGSNTPSIISAQPVARQHYDST